MEIFEIEFKKEKMLLNLKEKMHLDSREGSLSIINVCRRII